MKKMNLILATMFVFLLSHNPVLGQTECDALGQKSVINTVVGMGEMYFNGYNHAKKSNIKYTKSKMKSYIKASCTAFPKIGIEKIFANAADTNFSLSFADKNTKNMLKNLLNIGVMKTCHMSPDYLKKKGNKFSGPVHTILKKYSETTGLKIKYHVVKWDSCLKGMESGKYDVVTLASKKPERTKYMDYYFPAGNKEDSIAISKKSKFAKFPKEIQASVDLGL